MTWIPSRYLILDHESYVDGLGNEVRFAYSGRSATLFPIEGSVAARLGEGSVELIDSTELARLAGLQAIVPQEEDELSMVLQAYARGSADPGTRRFTIMPTSYCNMACAYCGQEHSKGPIDHPRIEQITRRVEATLAHPASREVRVAWFGGEPLLGLRIINEMSTRFVAAADAAGKKYSAHMATNGSLLRLRTLEHLHRECRLATITVTVDGPQQVHDRRRLKRNGVGSFHHTITVLANAVQQNLVPDLGINIRVNVDSLNEDHVAALIADLSCFGLASPQVELQLYPVHSWGNDVSAVELESRRYAAMETRWLRLADELGINFMVLPGALKRTTCNATSVYGEIIDATGNVYSCSEHPLVPTVRESGIVATVSELAGAVPRPRGAFDDWYEQVGDSGQPCNRCPLLPVCGGGCPKLWREGHVPCPSMKFNWSGRVAIAARRLGYRPSAASDKAGRVRVNRVLLRCRLRSPCGRAGPTAPVG
jgi:uncharacterized protein